MQSCALAGGFASVGSLFFIGFVSVRARPPALSLTKYLIRRRPVMDASVHSQLSCLVTWWALRCC